MEIKSENNEVFYMADSNVMLKKMDFDQLHNYALKSTRNRARYCAHKNKESDLHEMFEIFTQETYLRPLKQINKSYSYHVIQGSVDVYLFSEIGEVTDIISLGDFQSGKPFYFRAPQNVYRTLVTTSKFVLYHEVTTGPFKKEDTLFAPWAPVEDDVNATKQFLLSIQNYQKNSMENFCDY